MFTLTWTKLATAQFAELQAKALASLQNRTQQQKKKSSQAEGLFKQVTKAVALLASNPKHPGLQTHAYESLSHEFEPGKKVKVFEAYVQNQTPGAYRVFWCYGPGEKQITIIAITPHP